MVFNRVPQRGTSLEVKKLISSCAACGEISLLSNGWGGWHSTEVAFALLTQLPRVGFSAFPEIYFLRNFFLSMLLRFIDRTALLSIKWTVQRLSNVDRTHLVVLGSTIKQEEEKEWAHKQC